LLGGMAALPGSDWTETQPTAAPLLAKVRHVFTHFSLDLHVECRSEPAGDGWWHPLEALNEAGLPSLYLRAVEEVLRGRRLLAA
jgi:A/G-specific adenine glycosylase